MDKIRNICAKIMDGFQKLIMYFAIFIATPFLIYYTYSTYININDGQTYHKEYINKSVTANLTIGLDDHPIYYGSYKRGIRIYGATFGHIFYFTFKDSTTDKYFKISIFDKRYEDRQTEAVCNMKRVAIVSHVNKDDLNNPLYGTQENPIPIFDFKGKDEPIIIGVGAGGGKPSRLVNVEPTQEEYEHNVITYLTYIMPKKEFKKRFKNK